MVLATRPRGSLKSGKRRIALALEDRWRTLGLKGFLEAQGFAIEGHAPDVVLADVPRHPEAVRDALITVHTRFPTAGLLAFLIDFRLPILEACLSAGAMGVLDFNSEPQTIIDAIAVVGQGGIWAPRGVLANVVRILSNSPFGRVARPFDFTRAERRVLGALRDGLTNKEIGRLLGRSEATVKFHMRRLLQKTHATNRHELRRLVSGE